MSRPMISASHGEALRTQVYEWIKEKIIRGEYHSGHRLSTREIANDFGISITPVREAINLLANEGFVEVHARSGVRVKRFSAEDIFQIYQIRLLIEPEAARQTVATLDEKWFRRMNELVDSLDRLRQFEYDENYDVLRAAMELDSEFHSHIVDALKNPRLSAFHRSQNAHWRVARILYLIEPAQIVDIISSDHRSILAAYEAADADGVYAALRDHLTRSLNLQVSQLEKERERRVQP